MIESKELRIGNWVITDSEEQVIDVLCDSINTKEYECLTYDLVNPIPITEDWLVRFGFNKVNHIHNGVIWVYPLIKITWYPNGMIELRGSLGWQRIQYIHQLQNLYFALTGQELELKES